MSASVPASRNVSRVPSTGIANSANPAAARGSPSTSAIRFRIANGAPSRPVTDAEVAGLGPGQRQPTLEGEDLAGELRRALGLLGPQAARGPRAKSRWRSASRAGASVART